MEIGKKNQNNLMLGFTYLIFLCVWVILGHYVPQFILLSTAFVLPLLFSAITYTYHSKISCFLLLFIPFPIILVNDYLFRIYGGGVHDEVGKALCDVVFRFTLLFTFLALIANVFIYEKNKRKRLLHFGLLAGYTLIAYNVFTFFSNVI